MLGIKKLDFFKSPQLRNLAVKGVEILIKFDLEHINKYTNIINATEELDKTDMKHKL